MGSRVDESQETLESRDWSNAEVDTRPQAESIAISVRMHRELADRLFAEAERRRITASQVIRYLVDDGLDTVDGSATVRVADVHRVIDALTRKDPHRGSSRTLLPTQSYQPHRRQSLCMAEGID